MEEKKLTDEDVVKALECCSKSWDCNNCKRNKENNNRFICSENLLKDCLDLIHRLQAENAEGKARMKELTSIAEYQQHSNIERWGIIQEKDKEIERLTEREKFLENAWHISLESANTLDIALDASRAREQEYKKQVDELKLDLENWKKAAYGYKYAEEQAVKDTAKEICEMIDGTCISSKGYLCSIISKRYGVEVE